MVTEGVAVPLEVPVAEDEPLDEAVPVAVADPVVEAVGVIPDVTEGVTLGLPVAVTEDDSVALVCARERPRIAKRTRTTTRAMVVEENK